MPPKLPQQLLAVNSAVPEFQELVAALGFNEQEKAELVVHSLEASAQDTLLGLATAFRIGTLIGYLYAKKEKNTNDN